ncbi:MAG: HAD family hydrolase [Bacteroidales bacterium]|nr:HAD family hydrolase [Bacteroidales bacterium]
MKIKALFFDIDGTLVPFGHTEPSEATFAALRRAKEAGIKIFIATGRPMMTCTSVEKLAQEGLIDGYITMNGAFCIVDDTPVFDRPLSKETAKKILDFSHRHTKPTVVVGRSSNSIYNINEHFGRIFYDQIRTNPKLTPVSKEEAFANEIYQLSIFISEDEEPDFVDQMGAPDDMVLARWHPDFTDICTSDKAIGMEAVCKHLGISLSETAAFGDGGNDVPMIKAAAIGVAMGQSIPYVKAAADWIAPTCEDEGVAWAIDKILESEAIS